MLKQRTIILAILLILGGSLLVAGSTSPAAAATSFSIESIGGQVGLGDADLKQVIINVIRWVLGIVTLAAVGYMIYGGVLWMTSAGNEQRIEKAKQVILQASIGLVIILLAWAIVFFVVKTTANLTTNDTAGQSCVGPGCSCPFCGGQPDTFDITAASSCAVAPDFSQDVPLSSNISFTFNSDVEALSVKDAFDNNVLRIKKCSSTAAGYDCSSWVPATATTPKEIEPQSVAPGDKPTGLAGATKAEWVTKNNTLTFYHLSFSDDPSSADNRWFEAQSGPPPKVAYRITIPRQDPAPGAPANPYALMDTKLPSPRRLVHCQRPGPLPIIGDSIIGEHCQENANEITWDFVTGTDTVGQPLTVMSTTPSSEYLSDPTTLSPDRNIPRNPILGINFDGGLDPFSADMSNFQISRFNVPPTQAGSWADGTTAAPLSSNDFNMRVNDTGTGVWVQYKQTASCSAGLCSDGTRKGLSCTAEADCPQQRLFESFTWYKIEAKDFRNLCGTTMPPPTKTWVFETNDVTPGVAQEYPSNGFQFACPTTRVFIQFNTSMWDITEDPSKCSLTAPSSFNLIGALLDDYGNPVAGRSFTLMDPVPSGDPDPNKWCKNFEFIPNTAGLATGAYHGGVYSTMLKDAAGTQLSFGDQPPLTSPPTDGSGWGFGVKPPDQCYQPPVISKVDPSHDILGACVSVMGDYFKDPASPPGTIYPRAGDKLTLGTQTQSVPAGAWQQNSIVSTVGGLPVGTYDYQATVDYPAPIGPLVSKTHPDTKFTIDPGVASSNRPCLFSVDPNLGLPGQSGISANGKYFGTKTLQAKFLSTNPGPWSSGVWTDTNIANIAVDPGAIPGVFTQVRVMNSAGKVSNALPFTVDPPTVPVVGAPAVDISNACNKSTSTFPSPNPFIGDTKACLNSQLSVQFTLNMDPASFISGSTVKVMKCPGGVCGAPLAAKLTVANKLLTIDLLPAGTKFEKNMEYHVVLTKDLKATAADGGQTMAADNTAWKFTTQNDDADCPIENVMISPAGPVTVTSATYPPQGLTAVTTDDACRTLSTAGLTFNWTNTNLTVGVLNPPAGTTDQEFLVYPGAGASTGSTVVNATVQSIKSPDFTFNYDPLYCGTSDAECVNGAACAGSKCVDHKCTPVINSLMSNAGPVKTWTTIKGCYFGDYVSGASSVKFGTTEATIPDPDICGAGGVWFNDYIVREVPALPLGGYNVQVTRADSETVTKNNAFTVNNDPLNPGLCKLNPSVGVRQSATNLAGRDFGGIKGTVNFGPVSGLVPTTWADALIDAQVPTGAVEGPNDVVVNKSSALSNPVPYTVISGSGSCTTTLCADDDMCLVAGQGCGYDNCCAARPKITEFDPLQNTGLICRNTIPKITFDQPLDPSTVTAGPTGTVQYQDGARNVNGAVGYQTTAENEGEISYYPGLLSAGNRQRMSFSSYAPDPTAIITVNNPSFETADAAGVPDQWPNPLKAIQSDEVPPGGGHGSHSALADCSACTGSQAYIAQNIGNTHDNAATYRVTGWVKVEAPNGTSAGLITRCASGSCNYDLGNTAPGLFSGSTGDWRYLDFTITNSGNFSSDISIDCFANAKAKVWCDDISVTKVSAGATLTEIRGANGVLADTSDAPLNFFTGIHICTIDYVGVVPANTTFTAPGQFNSAFLARAFSNAQASQISQVPNSYAWTWSWGSQTPSVATAAMTTAEDVDSSKATVTAVANGNTTVTATAKIVKDTILKSEGKTIDGQANVSVKFCERPWKLDPANLTAPNGFTDSSTNCDLNNGPGQCGNYNFSLSYCRDNGAAPWPNFNYTGSSGAGLGSIEGVNADRLKTYFFKESTASRDTIGLLIFNNDEFLSPYDWFKNRFPLDTSGSSTVIGGYPAVKSGTTTYIGVTNYTGSLLQGLMFVFDYNSNNASPETVQIAGQMIDSIIFNRTLNPTQSNQLIRDTRRRQDLTSMKLLLNQYQQKNGAYPNLAAGSFIPGFSTSKWPSWQATLGGELATTLPLDPKNEFSAVCTAPYEASSCWSETLKEFKCPAAPAKSQIYGYRYSGAAAANLYTTMEFTLAGTFIQTPAPSGICISPNKCDCFNYTLAVTPTS